MNIYIAADHRGFNLKNELVSYLKERHFEVFDLGASSYDVDDDYPIFAQKLAKEVVKEKDNRGIILCGSGVGVDIAANKFDGIRASIGHVVEQVVAGRRDDDMNVLVLAADFIDIEKSKAIVDAFLKTEYERNEKRERRLDEIASFEKNN